MKPADTSPEAWRFFLDLVRRVPPEERLQRALQLSATVRQFGEAGLRHAYPQASDREIFLHGAERRLGSKLFREVYGDELPDDRPTRRVA